MQFSIQSEIAQYNKPKLYGPEQCPVYLQLAWTDEVRTGFARQFKVCSPIFYSIYCLFSLLKAICKNVLMLLQLSIFTNVSEMQNILAEPFRGQRPGLISTCQLRSVEGGVKTWYRLANTSGSTIAEHLINNPICTSTFSSDLFHHNQQSIFRLPSKNS